jgi:hypothetical protein
VRHPRNLTQTFAVVAVGLAVAAAVRGVARALESAGRLAAVVIRRLAEALAASSRFEWGPNFGFARCLSFQSCSRTTGLSMNASVARAVTVVGGPT